MKQITASFFLSLFFLAPFAQAQREGPAEAKQILVVFRYDDYRSASPTNLELTLINAFQERGVSSTFGVLPFATVGTSRDLVPLSASKAEILKKAMESGTVDVAMHGYSHQNVAVVSTEFRGLDYSSQMLRIDTGKRTLERLLGKEITTFIPPWNTFDSNTIAVLERLGFHSFSSSINEAVDIPRSSRLKYLPSTSSLSRVRTRVDTARRIDDRQPIIVVLFHSTDFAEDNPHGGITLEEFGGLLDWLTAQKDVQIVSMEQAVNVVDDLSADRFINFTDRFALRIVPPFLNELFSFPVGVYYMSTGVLSSVKLLACLIVALLHGSGRRWNSPFPKR